MTDRNQPIVNNPSFDMTEITPESQVLSPIANDVEGVNNRTVQGNENYSVLGNKNVIGNQFTKIENAYFNVSYQEDIKQDKQEINSKSRIEFILSGSIKDIDENKIKALEVHLRKISKDLELTILKVEEGSIKITVGAKPETLELLKQLFESGELNEILEFPIEDIQILGKEKSNNSSSTIVKNQPTQEIINAGEQLKELEQLLKQLSRRYFRREAYNSMNRSIRFVEQISSIRYHRRVERYRRVERDRTKRFIHQLSEAEKIIDQFGSDISEEQLNKIKQLKQQISRAKDSTSTSKEIRRT